VFGGSRGGWRGRRGRTCVELISSNAHRIYTQRSASVVWAMGGVADQTRSELTKVALGGCLDFCVRGGCGDSFGSRICAVSLISRLGDNARVG